MKKNSSQMSRRPRFLDKLMVFLPVLMVGRVQEIFPILHPLRLLLVSSLLLILVLLANGGFATSRLALLWHSKTFHWFITLVGIMLFSVLFSIYKSQSLFYWVDFCQFFGFLLIALNCQIDRKEDLRYPLMGIAFTLGVMSFLGYVAPRYVDGRVASSWSYDPNDTALFFIMILALVLPAAKYVRSLYKWGLYLITVMSIGIIILTESRGGLIAAVVALLAWGMSRGFKGMLKLLLIGTLGVVLILAVVPSEKLARFNTILNLEEDYNVTAKHGRLDLWKNGLVLLGNHWLTGTGLSTFLVAEGQIHEGGKWMRAHNSFLEIAVELGLPGFFIFMGMLISAYKRAKPRNDADWLGSGIRFSLIAYGVGGMFLSWSYHIVLYFVLSIAMMREKILVLEDVSAQNVCQSGQGRKSVAESGKCRHSVRIVK